MVQEFRSFSPKGIASESVQINYFMTGPFGDMACG